MKDSNYFSHDFGARNDPKLIELQMEMGGQGLAIFWCIVEMLWENDGYFPINYRAIAFSLHWAEADDVRRVVEDFGLFENDGKVFWSKSALDRIGKRRKVSDIRRESGRSGRAGRPKTNAVDEDDADGITDDEEANAKQMLSDEKANAEQVKSNCFTMEKQMLSDEKANAEQVKSNCLYKERKKEINKEINNYSFGPRSTAAEEKEQIFEIFFFEKNFRDPGGELDRFWNYYKGNGWTLGKGRKVTDKYAVARQWQPEDKDPHFDRRFIDWWHKVYLSARDGGGFDGHAGELISGLADAKVAGDRLEISLRSEDLAKRAMGFVDGSALASCWDNIIWKRRR